VVQCGEWPCKSGRIITKFGGREHEMESWTFTDASGKRRCTVFACGDGSCSFQEEKFSDDPMEMCWLPLTWRRSQPICATFEIALREARGRVEWLRETEDAEPGAAADGGA
jgi:hypothetical protein